MTEYYLRRGGSDGVDESNFDEAVKLLLEDLRTEEFEEPDDEHTQVSIGNDLWSVTAQIWLAVLQKNKEDLLSSNWVQFDQLPEYEADCYRK